MRKKPGLRTATALAALLGGCGPAISFFPLYTPEDKVFDEQLLGTWKGAHPPEDKNSDTSIWKFERGEDGVSYDFTLMSANPKTKGRLLNTAHLVRLGDFLFIDFETPDGEKREMTDYPLPEIPGHFIGRILIERDKIHIGLLDDSWIGERVKAGSMPLTYLESPHGRVLTAKTEELRKFCLTHATDTQVFGDTYDLVRAK